MKLHQIVCDGCGAVLRGQHGREAVRKENIAIRGMITLFSEDGDYVHVTSHAQEDMSFCNIDCFKEFANRRLAEYEKRRVQRLREEAEYDATHPSETSYGQ